MNKLSVLVLTSVLSGTGVVTPTLAENTAIPPAAVQSTPTLSKQGAEYTVMSQEAYKMMGHIGIANIALLHDFKTEASESVNKALVIARKLEKQTASLNADLIKLGKFKYREAEGKTKDYWLPIVNDRFVVNDLYDTFSKGKQPVAEEDDVQLVHASVALNTKQIRELLEQASASLVAKDYAAAEVALVNAQQSVFAEQTVREAPLATARDNLILAKALAKSKDYTAAGFALTHAKEALAEYQQQTMPNEKSDPAAKIKAGIESLQKEIANSEPSLASSIESRINMWIRDIENL